MRGPKRPRDDDERGNSSAVVIRRMAALPVEMASTIAPACPGVKPRRARGARYKPVVARGPAPYNPA